MGSEHVIQLADLTRIAENLSAIHSKIEYHPPPATLSHLCKCSLKT